MKALHFPWGALELPHRGALELPHRGAEGLSFRAKVLFLKTGTVDLFA